MYDPTLNGHYGYYRLREADITIAGKPVSPRQLWRWCRHGVRGEHLRHGRVGREYVVRVEDVIEFVQRLGDLDCAAATQVKSAKKRVTESQRRLERAGI